MIFRSLHYVSYISFHVVLESSSKNPKVTADCEEPRLTGAIRSFPDEVQLCVSSIPGASYGVCAKEHIPLGTWIGPYEGKRITSQQLTPQIDSEHLWEVQLILYLHFCFFSLDTILNTTNVSWQTFFLEKLTQQYCVNLEPWKQKAFLSRHVLINENVRSDWGLCERVPKMFLFRSLLNDFAFDRFSKMVTWVTSLMAATKTIQAGCVSFAVRATPTNRTYMHSNIVETSFIEHSRKFLLAENF